MNKNTPYGCLVRFRNQTSLPPLFGFGSGPFRSQVTIGPAGHADASRKEWEHDLR